MDDDGADIKTEPSARLLIFLRYRCNICSLVIATVDLRHGGGPHGLGSEVRDALGTVLERALVREDPAARQLVDEVADTLRGRLRERLEAAGLPGQLAEGLQSPWRLLESANSRETQAN